MPVQSLHLIRFGRVTYISHVIIVTTLISVLLVLVSSLGTTTHPSDACFCMLCNLRSTGLLVLQLSRLFPPLPVLHRRTCATNTSS